MNIDDLKHLDKSHKQIKRLLSDSWLKKRALIKYSVKVAAVVLVGLVAWFSFLWVMTDIAVETQVHHRKQHSDIQSQLDLHIEEGHNHD